ncbi:type VI lipase adapter Tla3 domain-containing protein [Pseudomonas huanghezhanensis]|uniref:type VI lipase adapter Tla3 domain-containing protein n=1 Tax=Pseudomonas huanghezhanensis TaxID=3002903 RepID=UPI0022866B97|nr:DUF2875 family protein [Pseudomonas sp. BSw22131]
MIHLKGTGQGIAGIITAVMLVFGGHWSAIAMAQSKLDKQVQLENKTRYFAEQQDREQRTFSLEIRAAGLAVDEDQQSTIWRLIRKKNSNFSSIFSGDPKDYPDTADSRTTTSSINIRAAARHSARDAVAYWPMPTFAIGPESQPGEDIAATDILGARNAATLGVNLFLWQASEDTTHAQHIIERVFQFFAENAEVPEALILTSDGDVSRAGNRLPGTPGLPDGLYVPTVYESMTGLLLARTDRVDRYLRPFAVREEEDNQDKSTDLGKLWFFYWKHSPEFRTVYETSKKAEGVEEPYAPGTMSSAYWHAQLPELWKTTTHRGPGHFQPTKWLPIRWAQHQIDEFDEAPTLGYLHRPIKVSMNDEQGNPLKPAMRAKALQAGWMQALKTLPTGEKPVRVFYDSTHNLEGEVTLTQALVAMNVDGTGLDLSNVNEGYDIGRRLGNTGVSGALVEINLATIASYLDGGVSAVVYPGADGSATIQMIRPPSDAMKARNAETRWADPFKFGAPGAGS